MDPPLQLLLSKRVFRKEELSRADACSSEDSNVLRSAWNTSHPTTSLPGAPPKWPDDANVERAQPSSAPQQLPLTAPATRKATTPSKKSALSKKHPHIPESAPTPSRKNYEIPSLPFHSSRPTNPGSAEQRIPLHSRSNPSPRGTSDLFLNDAGFVLPPVPPVPSPTPSPPPSPTPRRRMRIAGNASALGATSAAATASNNNQSEGLRASNHPRSRVSPSDQSSEVPTRGLHFAVASAAHHHQKTASLSDSASQYSVEASATEHLQPVAYVPVKRTQASTSPGTALMKHKNMTCPNLLASTPHCPLTDATGEDVPRGGLFHRPGTPHPSSRLGPSFIRSPFDDDTEPFPPIMAFSSSTTSVPQLPNRRFFDRRTAALANLGYPSVQQQQQQQRVFNVNSNNNNSEHPGHEQDAIPPASPLTSTIPRQLRRSASHAVFNKLTYYPFVLMQKASRTFRHARKWAKGNGNGDIGEQQQQQQPAGRRGGGVDVDDNKPSGTVIGFSLDGRHGGGGRGEQQAAVKRVPSFSNFWDDWDGSHTEPQHHQARQQQQQQGSHHRHHLQEEAGGQDEGKELCSQERGLFAAATVAGCGGNEGGRTFDGRADDDDDDDDDASAVAVAGDHEHDHAEEEEEADYLLEDEYHNFLKTGH